MVAERKFMRKTILTVLLILAATTSTVFAGHPLNNQNDIASRAEVMGLKLGMTITEAIPLINKQVSTLPEITAVVTRRWPADASGKESAFEITITQCSPGISDCVKTGKGHSKTSYLRFMPSNLGAQLVSLNAFEYSEYRMGLRKTEILNMMGERPQSVSTTDNETKEIRNYYLWGGLVTLTKEEMERVRPAIGGRYVLLKEEPQGLCRKSNPSNSCGFKLYLEIEDSAQYAILLKEMRKQGMLLGD